MKTSETLKGSSGESGSAVWLSGDHGWAAGSCPNSNSDGMNAPGLRPEADALGHLQ